MFLIRTRIGPSKIHGTGVFACETAEQGTVIWKFEPLFDREVLETDLAKMPAAFREYVEMYAYRAADLGGRLILSADHARFLNHSDDPNTGEVPFASIAKRKINVGDEITCDYGAFCTDGTGFEFDTGGASSKPDGELGNQPHRNLHTRLYPSKDGIGVFAIRDIPKGTRLFVGDTGETVPVPQLEVEQITDEEVRRMYTDFCPLVDGHYIAPVDFNQMTMGWYLNHSSDPNVMVLENMCFVASKFIAKGAELCTDYTTYSESAKDYVKDWG